MLNQLYFKFNINYNGRNIKEVALITANNL